MAAACLRSGFSDGCAKGTEKIKKFVKITCNSKIPVVLYSGLQKGGPLSCLRKSAPKALKRGMNAYKIGGIYPWI